MSAGEIHGSVEIRRPVEDVFGFVADPRNDPGWCERVKWCRQVAGERPDRGARYEALHKPSGYPRAHIRRIEVLEIEEPRFVRWRQADRLADFDIAYELEAVDGGTRLTQRDRIKWRLPGMGFVGRSIVKRHIGDQHAALRALLEA